jgi:hypothetical protein
VLLDWYRVEQLAKMRGHGLDLPQANRSVSAAGVIRGSTSLLFRRVRPSTSRACTAPCSTWS